VFEKLAEDDRKRYVAEVKALHGTTKGIRRKVMECGAPKRPMSAYLHFSNKRRAKFKKDHPGASTAELSRMLSHAWKTCDPAVKATYVNTEKEQRAKYKEAYAKWKREKKQKEEEEQDSKPAAIASVLPPPPVEESKMASPPLAGLDQMILHEQLASLPPAPQQLQLQPHPLGSVLPNTRNLQDMWYQQSLLPSSLELNRHRLLLLENERLMMLLRQRQLEEELLRRRRM